MSGPSLLLHACCAPCFAYVHEILEPSYGVTAYFYNPNIAPREEYNRRLGELRTYAGHKAIPLIVEETDQRDWVREIKPLRFQGERSARCEACFLYRLDHTFRYAREEGYSLVGTVLSISPHKDAAMINRIGKALERSYGIEFLEADFKKNDGFRRSVDLSRKMGFYRQDYCGCIYSKMDRLNQVKGASRIYGGLRDHGARGKRG